MFAVGKPKPVPRLAPPTTVPATRHSRPSRRAAPLTSPCARRRRMALDEKTSPSSAPGGSPVRPKPGGAPGVPAEEEVVPDNDMPGAEAIDDDAVDELVG